MQSQIQNDLDNKVSESIGRDVGISGIPTIQWFFLGIFMFAAIFFIRINLTFSVFLFCGLSIAWFALTGNDPQAFFHRFGKPPAYISAEPYMEEEYVSEMLSIPRSEKIPKTVTRQVRGRDKTFTHVEGKYDFVTHVQIHRDRSAGCYLLQKKQNLMFIFVWEVTGGNDPSVLHSEAVQFMSSAPKFLTQLPFDVDIKGRFDCIQDASGYIASLEKSLNSPSLNSLERQLVLSKIEKARQMESPLSDTPILSTRYIITAKFKIPVGSSAEFKRNVIERELYKGSMAVGVGAKTATYDRWEQTIKLAYDNAFKPVESIIESHVGLGLKVRALDVHEIHEMDWYELHNDPCPEIPHYLLYDNLGLQGPIKSEIAVEHMDVFSPERGQNVNPQFADNLIYIPRKEKYAAFLRIGKPYGSFPEYPTPAGFSKALGMYRYNYDRMNRNSSGNPFRDYRIVWEVARDDSGIERISLDRNISYSTKRAAEAIAKGTRDVVNEDRQEDAADARRKVKNNDKECHFALGIWLYRDTIEQLNFDMKALAGEFSCAKTERPAFHIKDYWDQSWLFEGALFLTKPSYNCQKVLASNVIPQIPRIIPPKLDSSGIPLLNKESRTLNYLDLCRTVANHTAILGFTGAGKSLLISDMIVEALISNIPVVVFDFPRPDGTSTYKDMTDFLRSCGKKCAYYNVKQSINAIEFINLEPFLENGQKGKDYNDRYEILVADHVELLSILILGAEPLPGEERDYVPEIAKMYNEFLAQPHIQERQAIAAKAGFGNPGYELMPTIEGDLYPFVKGDQAKGIVGWASKMRLENPDARSVQIYSDIERRLGSKLHTKLGNSIKGPSSFDIDVDFLVVALTEVKANDESLIFANSGLNILVRKAMQAYAALAIVDEGTTLFKIKQFARRISDFPPTARKYGCNFVLGAQVIEPIISSGYAKVIFGNMRNKILGFCTESIYQEMISPDIGMRPEIARKYLSKNFMANPHKGESYWHLMRDTSHYELTFSASDLLLAMNSNNPDEVAARRRFKAKFADKNDPSNIDWLLDYSKVYAKACKMNIPFSQILPDVSLDDQRCEDIAA